MAGQGRPGSEGLGVVGSQGMAGLGVSRCGRHDEARRGEAGRGFGLAGWVWHGGLGPSWFRWVRHRVARSGWARQAWLGSMGLAWPGLAGTVDRRVMARLGLARLGVARQAWSGGSGLGMASQGRRGAASFDSACPGKACLGRAGLSGHCLAGLCAVSLVMAWQVRHGASWLRIPWLGRLRLASLGAVRRGLSRQARLGKSWYG